MRLSGSTRRRSAKVLKWWLLYEVTFAIVAIAIAAAGSGTLRTVLIVLLVVGACIFAAFRVRPVRRIFSRHARED